jgi:hypothetical protein
MALALDPTIRSLFSRFEGGGATGVCSSISMSDCLMKVRNKSHHESLSIKLDGVVPEDLSLGFIRNWLSIEFG